ncbi:MAG: hypothetical protein ACYDCX_13655, partial [Acidithiobacillus sp.]
MRRIFLGIILLTALWPMGSVLAEDNTALNCPAIAAKMTYRECGNPQTPVGKAICNTKLRGFDYLPGIDRSIIGAYVKALRAAGIGTSDCKALLEWHARYEKQLAACGTNDQCLLKNMDTYSRTLTKIEDRLQTPLSDAALQRFAGGVWLQSPGEPPAPLLERIRRGLSIYPLPRMALPNGNTLYWGFQPHNATLQALVIVDRQGTVQLVGAVDGIYLGLPEGKAVPQLEPDAQIALFVRDAQALQQNLPAIRGWAAASVLGFNVECNAPGAAARCSAAEAIALPLHAYDLRCGQQVHGKVLVNRCPLP